ncbi:hypothetical protein RvY_09034-2 [Ramazzottius varieornatus]|uniref:C-CAP/cofactor C-like domain-containing protein n=1 Tax=Ramazzottius varieornatus TaxID=947166 RepID=A0A1D1V7X7_RAMVA|nr:hypothetical protein RvY_09034-2 [Ramazzottius varieornatus]
MGQVLAVLRNLLGNGTPTMQISTVDSEILNRRRLSSTGQTTLKSYSWSNRLNTINPDDYKHIGLESRTIVHQPGSIKGHQFIIERCRNCNIFLFDWTDSITILDCTGCAIFVGPCKGSTFVRNCDDCTILVLCQQFRTRDCRRISVHLCCSTKPIIENTVAAKFACLQVSYGELEGQMAQAGLSPFNNNWTNVHDFTPNNGEGGTSHNFSLITDELATAKVGLNDPEVIGETDLLASFDPSISLVPFTTGNGPASDPGEDCLVIVFATEKAKSSQLARSFVSAVRAGQPAMILLSTMEITMLPHDLRRILHMSSGINSPSGTSCRFRSILPMYTSALQCSDFTM